MKKIVQLIFILFILNASAQDNIIFKDDFSNNANKWALENSEQGVKKIENGKYTLKSFPSNNVWAIMDVPAEPFRDYQISANLKQINGDDNRAYGLVYGTQDATHYLEFIITSNSYYQLRKIDKDVTTLLKDWTVSRFVNGMGINNNLTIKNIKGTHYFYINNNFVASFPSLTLFGSSIGFINYMPAKEVAIDDIVVEYIDTEIKTEKIAKTTTTQSNTQLSDIDLNIPVNQITKDKTYAIIIGNEDYSSNQTGLSTEVNVEFAENDAKSFKEYCIKTLGIPEKNVTLLVNATGSKMLQNIDWLAQLAKASNGNAELIFYYAGHGLPDEQTKEPYLIPVDVSGKDLKYAVKLMDIYKKLTENPTKKVTVFLDACFSGGARNESLIAQRGVKVKPKENVIGDNLFVFTSSSGEESSAPYKEKYHGLFTYFLLKKIQETKGDITYIQLAEYLKTEVSINSLLINKKQQTPQTLGSMNVEEKWKNWKLK